MLQLKMVISEVVTFMNLLSKGLNMYNLSKESSFDHCAKPCDKAQMKYLYALSNCREQKIYIFLLVSPRTSETIGGHAINLTMQPTLK
jgi:hypothetical protein